MATKNLNLGIVPVSRGEFNSTTIYYKDNIVQYKRGSYQVISESPIIGVSPTNDNNVVNPGWTLFAGTLDAQDVVNQVKDQETKSIQAVAAREAEILAKSDAAEVRFNNTGTSFSGTNVQDVLKETNGRFSELESEVDRFFNIPLESGYYPLATSENIIHSKAEAKNFKCALIRVEEGQKFIIQSIGSSMAIIYAFGDKDRNILEKADDGLDTTSSSIEIVAPRGAKYLAINANLGYGKPCSARITYAVPFVVDEILKQIDYLSDSKTEIDDYNLSVSLKLTNGYYITSVGSKAYKLDSDSVVSAIVRCNAGDVFKVAGNCTSKAKVWATLDENMIVKRVASSDDILIAESVLIEDGEKYILCNSYASKNYAKLLVCSLFQVIKEQFSFFPQSNKEDKYIGNFFPTAISINKEEFSEGYIDINGTSIVSTSSMMYSGYIEINPLMTFTLNNFCSAAFTYCHLYDSNKNVIGRLSSEDTGNPVNEKATIAPSNARYIRFSILSSQLNTCYAYYNLYENNYLSKALYDMWIKRSNQPLENLFAHATSKTLVTIIDDDTLSLEHISKFYNMCQSANIKGTFACLTQVFATYPQVAIKLKEYERMGFQTVLHGFSQASQYQNPTSAENIAFCEDDLVHGLQDLQQNGFVDYKFWVVPFGTNNDNLHRLAKKWGFECSVLVTSGMEGFEDVHNATNRFAIRRIGLNPTDGTGSTTLSALKNIIDEATKVGGWVLVCTHAYAWDEYISRFTEFVSYAKSKGCEFTTLGEAWRIRRPIYEFNETF